VNKRYGRQSLLPWLGTKGQEALSNSCAAVVGLGALGCLSASFLARAGVGRLLLVDRDFVEESNLARQLLYDEEDCRQRLPKAVAAAQHLQAARGDLQAEARVADLDADLAKELFGLCAAVLDGTDNFETRYLVNDAAIFSGKPWIYGGAVSTYGSVMVVRPGLTPCLRCLFPDPPPPGSAPTCDTAGILAPAAGLVASLQAGEALKILVGRADLCAGGLLHADLLNWSFSRVSGERTPQCPACGQRHLDYLEEKAGTRTHRVCGRDGIMILAPKGTRLDLKAVKARLEAVAPVFSNPYLLQTEWDGHPVTLYPDGRVLIQKTDDPARARSLYARYLGM
jgi:molybdopterin/thiamine biosynthesis adenylyltransferase